MDGPQQQVNSPQFTIEDAQPQAQQPVASAPSQPSTSQTPASQFTVEDGPVASHDQAATLQNLKDQNDKNYSGVFDRTYQSSLKGMVDLAKESLGYSAQKPLDIYHEMMEASKRGDHVGMAKAALQLANLASSGTLDKDHPLVKAGTAMLLAPVEQYKAAQQQELQDLKNVAAGGRARTTGERVSDALMHGVKGVPVIGGAVGAMTEPFNKDLAEHNYAGMAGDVLGPLLTMGVTKGLSALGDSMEGVQASSNTASGVEQAYADSIRPGTVKIAGQEVPVSAKNPLHPASESLNAKATGAMSTPEAGADFVAEHTQPAAVKATQANFTKSGLSTVDELKAIRGEAPISDTPPSGIQNVSDLSELMKKEAKTTFSKLDDAADAEIKDWTAEREALEKTKPAPPKKTGIGRVDEDAMLDYQDDLEDFRKKVDAWEKKNPQPKSFQKLQDQVNHTKQDIANTNKSQVEKAQAIDRLPEFEQEMKDFLDRNSHAVEPGEFRAANKVHAQSVRYDWIAKRIRTAMRGTDLGLQTENPSLSRANLRGMKAGFDNKFGDGEFENLLGPEGTQNFAKIIDVLDTPEAGKFIKWVRTVPFGIGRFAHTPFSAIADNLLFNPEFGQTALKLYEASKSAGAATVRGTGTAVKATGKVTPTAAVTGLATSGTSKSSAQAKQQIFNGATSLR